MKLGQGIVRLFLERAGNGSAVEDPDQIMTRLVESARTKRAPGLVRRLQQFLDARKVSSIEVVPGLDCDGVIRPLGSTFADGFAVTLKKGLSQARSRFTLAHEACHTFFYEFAPELKFVPHETDDVEERLCNLGAAVLLIPGAALRKQTRSLTLCLNSLEGLAARHVVSMPAMLLRLRALGLWKCQLSRWHRTVGGTFVLDRLYGGRRNDWQWDDHSLLDRVWQSREEVFGRVFLYLSDRQGNRRYAPVSCNLRRERDGILALWGPGVRAPLQEYPLLPESLRSCG